MKILSRLARISALVAALLAVTCCGLNYDPELPAQAYLRLYFDVPATKAVDTADYSDPDNREGADNMLVASDLDVWFFTPSGSFVCKASGTRDIAITQDSDLMYDPHYHRYIAEIRVDKVVDGANYRVVVVANRRLGMLGSPFSVPAFELSQGVGSTDEEKLYSLLRYSFYNASDVAGRFIRNYVEQNCLKTTAGSVPMWGFKEMTANVLVESDLSSAAPSETIDLVRSVAKVRVQISNELSNYVRVTGITARTRSVDGFMTPSYSRVMGLTQSPDMLGKDVSGGSYTNAWINAGSQTSGPGVYVDAPFYMYPGNNAYYVYLPESEIGNAHIDMSFEWKDPALNGAHADKTLHFADYEQAAADLLGGRDIPLTDDQLAPYRFPVMRNHYYIYTITKLDPLQLKFEVCEWQYRSTEITFN